VSDIRLVVNNDTGEVETTLGKDDKISRKNTTEYLKRTTDISDAEFVKLYLCAADMLSRADDLTIGSMRVCLRLLQYIRYDTGLISWNNGEPIHQENIIHICNSLSERTVKRALECLVVNDIFAVIRRDGYVSYAVNPYVFMKGKRVNKTLEKMFHNSKWARLHETTF